MLGLLSLVHSPVHPLRLVQRGHWSPSDHSRIFYNSHSPRHSTKLPVAVVLNMPLSGVKPQFIGAPVVAHGTGELLATASLLHCVVLKCGRRRRRS